jgi:hypothetical protein
MGIQKSERNTGGQKFRCILATHGISSVETQAIQTTQLVTHDKWEDE